MPETRYRVVRIGEEHIDGLRDCVEAVEGTCRNPMRIDGTYYDGYVMALLLGPS